MLINLLLLKLTRCASAHFGEYTHGPSFQVEKQLLLCCLLMLLLNKTTKLKVENSTQRAGSLPLDIVLPGTRLD